MSKLRRLVIAAFWGCVAIAYISAIVPAQDAPEVWHWDKANHMLAFVVVTVLGRLAYPHVRLRWIFAGIVAFGGFIELSQAVPFIHRDADWADWAADIVATLAGLLLAWPLVNLAERRRANARTAAASAPAT